ncbi:MAG: helix-turn-helix transcriptional regulator [Propionicimonas sp.]|uniref:helix-turn-helix domain-containing protein n=1 Tax=Propionicimonas sp. TaxID=1955623 RepID=UPI002B201CA1|nr:helix-turn-helix transcriptional regulator [Propionicimonas sp.]MEA4942823.1 helix-turn-helix transcriptional regulator [Propionicimonas sp.]MEA5117682.1 helix-turn-helix transcriptional regulator [Propionicimonas sp.]
MAIQTTGVEFGRLLRESRRSQKMSQAELGGDRYSGSYISHLESGRRTPTPEVVEFLARRLGVSPLEWGIREHFDKAATMRAERTVHPGAVEDLLVAERAWYDRDWSSAEAHGQRAAVRAKAAGDAIRYWEAMYVVAQARFANAQFADAARIAEEISEWEAATTYAVARAQSLSLASIANRAGSRVGWAIALGARAVEAAGDAPPIILTEALMSLVSALSEAGHGADETGPYLQRLVDLMPQLSANHSRGMVAWTIGTAAYNNGDPVEGAARYDQARELLNPQRDLRLWLRFHRSDANCRLDLGSTDGVAELLRISSTGLEIIGNPFDVVELRQARARLALLEHNPSEAASIIEGILSDPVLGNAEYNHGMSEWILGAATQELGRREESWQHYRAAGELFEADGRLKQALEAYRHVSELCCPELDSRS